MATIRTAIQIQDGMTNPLRSITNALNMTISSFEAMQRVSGKAVDTHSIAAARAELSKAGAEFTRIEQEIRAADRAQQKLNNNMNSGQGAAGALLGKVKGWVGALGLAFGTKELFQLSDQFVSTTARLNLMNDGLQTTKQLQDEIFASSQRSRASYLDTAAAVSKLGILAKDAFKDNKEMIFFAEQMNKQFKIGGSSMQEQTSAMYQLTQAMAAGKLQGDEFRSIMENAPMLAQAISKYMGKTQGDLKKLSSEGVITADIIKNAMFEAADETNKKFAELPMTWGQLWTTITNNIMKQSEPILQAINWMANNWAILEPLILGAAGAVGVYLIAVYGATAATWALEKAQLALNAMMALNPVYWIAMAVVLLIALFYAAVAAVNKFTGTTYSATGMIVGAFYVAGAFIANIFIAMANIALAVFAGIWNFIATFAEFFANVFVDPVDSVVRLFAGMAQAVLNILGGLAAAIDAVFGSNLAGAVSGWSSSLQARVDARVGEPKVKVPRIDQSMMIKGLDYKSAYSKGYGAGEGLANRFSASGAGDLANIAMNTANTAANTGKMKDAMDATEEDLKYMRDLAEQEAINRFTTAEVKVDMVNNNQINSEMDLDGVISYFGAALEETIASVAEGV